MCLVLAASHTGDLRQRGLVGALGLVVYTGYRTVRPLRYRNDLASLLVLLAEVGITTLAVTATGYWESPLIFAVMTTVAVAGFARGFGFGIRVALVPVVATGVSWSAQPGFSTTERRTSLQWSVEVLLVAVVAGYARRISGEADRRQTLALDRLGRLSDANSLLYQLHAVTQTLPASLDQEEVLDATVAQLTDLVEADALALLLLDDTDGTWRTARRRGARPPARLTTEGLPAPALRAMRTGRLVHEPDLAAAGASGLVPGAGSGLYAALSARGSIIGVLSLEHRDAAHFTPRDVELVGGFVEPAALAIDNSRWFGRLRSLGAAEERTRIARDLHDRIGQSLAYLAFELDRIVRITAADEAVSSSLAQIRGEVRGVIGEVRDTLYDLRTDVSDTQSLPATLDGYLSRVRARSRIQVELLAEETGRLPVLQERELWRVAQEALTNVERHAEATRVAVTWRSDGQQAVLEVVDDGVGFTTERAGRLDSYGLLGMRERATSIGATLTIDSEPGRGTRVRCALSS